VKPPPLSAADRLALVERLTHRVHTLERQVLDLQQENELLRFETRQARELVASTIELRGRD
jgi:hypothetical protein